MTDTLTRPERGASLAPGRKERSPVLTYTVRRIISTAILCVLILLAPFFIVRAMPGDPAIRLAGTEATAEYVQQIRDDLDLEKPLPEQFALYVADLAKLELGSSYSTSEPVTKIIGDRFPYTAEIVLFGLAITLLVGVGGGVAVSLLTRGGRRQWLVRSFVVTSSAAGVIPEVVWGVLLASLLAIQFALLPISGATHPLWFILPSLAIGLRPGFNIARVIRAESVAVIRRPFIVTARSKRLSFLRVYLVHALPNIATAALTLTGLVFAFLLGGSVVIENLFALPGIGSELVKAVLSRDYPVIQGLMILIGVSVVIVNAVADILIVAIDRRSTLIGPQS